MTSSHLLPIRVKVEAGLIDDYANRDEVVITKRIKNLFHINSRKLIEFAVKVLTSTIKLESSKQNEEEKRMLGILYYSFYLEAPEKLGYKSFEDALYNLYSNNIEIIEEVVEILKYNYLHIDFVDKTVDLGAPSPLDLHCIYSIDQIMAALGYFNESRTSVESDTGQRYINHLNTGNKIILFVRENKKDCGLTTPYTYLGEAEYISHRGSTPISFVWRLKEEMPAWMVEVANKGAV